MSSFYKVKTIIHLILEPYEIIHVYPFLLVNFDYLKLYVTGNIQ